MRGKIGFLSGSAIAGDFLSPSLTGAVGNRTYRVGLLERISIALATTRLIATTSLSVSCSI